jgi:hypothetical protein
MGLWQWMSWRRPELAVAEVARRAATLVIESVRPLVERRIASMGHHEARGYVRARTGHLIADGIAMVTAHDRSARRYPQEALFAATLEHLLPVLLRRPTPAIIPVRSGTRRAA